jgi:hypothetical protein
MELVVPPGEGGVVDYSRLLAKAIGPSARVASFSPTTTHGKKILLQYSGYGFAKRGAPLWLISKLASLKSTGCSIGVCFHELYADGPPWRSSFWLSPVQKYVAQSVVKLANYWMTNREQSSQWLQVRGGDKPNSVVPTFSNVGELMEISQNRVSKALVFGGAALRTNAYRLRGLELFQWARNTGIQIHDIGPALFDPHVNDTLNRYGVIKHGMLSSAEVHGHMSESLFGIVAYPVDYIAKSGVFASYCAHGVCPIVFSKDVRPADQLVVGMNFLTDFPAVDGLQEAAVIAQRAWSWYQPHRIDVHANTVRRLCDQSAER